MQTKDIQVISRWCPASTLVLAMLCSSLARSLQCTHMRHTTDISLWARQAAKSEVAGQSVRDITLLCMLTFSGLGTSHLVYPFITITQCVMYSPLSTSSPPRQHTIPERYLSSIFDSSSVARCTLPLPAWCTWGWSRTLSPNLALVLAVF